MTNHAVPSLLILRRLTAPLKLERAQILAPHLSAI
jgi:hypothetical protein